MNIVCVCVCVWKNKGSIENEIQVFHYQESVIKMNLFFQKNKIQIWQKRKV